MNRFPIKYTFQPIWKGKQQETAVLIVGTGWKSCFKVAILQIFDRPIYYLP